LSIGSRLRALIAAISGVKAPVGKLLDIKAMSLPLGLRDYVRAFSIGFGKV
jgi:hypothetical protein